MNQNSKLIPHPKKSLGQNYLIDENICKKMVDIFEITPTDSVIEIGSGKGAITKYILKKTKKLIAVEFDKHNYNFLKTILPETQIVQEDILKIDFSDFLYKDKKLRVIGNIPYNLTSPILFKLIENRKYINDAQIMVQEEVARRLSANPNSKEYGITSVLTQTFTEVKLLFKVPPTCFYPTPKIYSRVLHLKFAEKIEKNIIDIELYRNIVRTAFNPRRKMLKNTLSNFKKEISNISLDWSKRAENLSVNDFIFISNEISKQKKKVLIH